MVITKDITLPSDKDLTVEELNLSSSTLMTAAPYVGKLCEVVNNEFMLCRKELNDPRACVAIGKQVTICALDAFRKIKIGCLKEFNQHANCVDKSSGDFAYSYCRNTQAIFDKCMASNVGIERPHYGYFCRGRIHKTSRKEPPKRDPCVPIVPDPTPSLPDTACRKPPRFGNRSYYMTE